MLNLGWKREACIANKVVATLANKPHRGHKVAQAAPPGLARVIFLESMTVSEMRDPLTRLTSTSRRAICYR